MTAMSAPNSRRWLRFSLRALLVAITLMCCWLGYERNAVKGRERLLRELRSDDILAPYHFFTAAQYCGRWPPETRTEAPTEVSFVRHWLGAEPMQNIWYMPSGDGFSEQKLLALRRAFPEAHVQEMPPPLPQPWE